MCRGSPTQARIASFDLRARIATLTARLNQRSGELHAHIGRSLTARLERVKRLRMQLDERSPLRVLERGYAIVYDAGGAVLRDTVGISSGNPVRPVREAERRQRVRRAGASRGGRQSRFGIRGARCEAHTAGDGPCEARKGWDGR